MTVKTLEDWKEHAEEWEALAYRYQAQRDALAAHVERLKSLGSLLVRNIDEGGGEDDFYDLIEKWKGATNESPTTSLARRDAEKLGDIALRLDREGHELLQSHSAHQNALGRERMAAATIMANESMRLRRQAEED